MIRILLLGVLLLMVARAFWRVMDGVISAAGGLPPDRRRGGGSAPPMKLVRDPVCGTHVPVTSALSARTGGTTHYFCSERCRGEFMSRRQAG